MSQKNKERILVTGGAGFIGSHLTDALIRGGYRVRVMDALLSPTHNGKLPEWFNRKAQFFKGDVRKKSDWARALKGVDSVFHLAAYMDYHLDFSNYFRTNTESAALLYEVIVEKKLPVKKIILASSQAVYGEGKYRCPTHGDIYPEPRKMQRLKKRDWAIYCACGKKLGVPIPQRENDLLFPGNPYGISKLALEHIALNMGRAFQIPTVVLRYSIVHGSRQSFRHFYSGALRSFAVQAIMGEPIEMQEDAGQLRDFVHIEDAIDAHLVVLKDPRADYEIFNVGSGRKDDVLNLAKIASDCVGASFQPDIRGIFRVGSARNSIMNVDKLKKLGWRPKHALGDNVRDYIAWIRNYPEAIRHLHRTYRDLRQRKILQ